MTARALAYWRGRLQGRAMPMLHDCADVLEQTFAGHVALFDLSGPNRRRRVRALGPALAAAVTSDSLRIAGDPFAEIISRLPALAVRQEPMEFEVELGNSDGPHHTLCLRGILLPLADRDGVVASILGVMTWRSSVAAVPADDILAAIACVQGREASPAPGHSAWMARPSEARSDPILPTQRLAAARTWAALARTDPARAADHRASALGAIHAAVSTMDDNAVAGHVRDVFLAEDDTFVDLAVQATLLARRIGLQSGEFRDGIHADRQGLADFVAGGERMRAAWRLSEHRSGFRLTSLDPSSATMKRFAAPALH